MKSASYLGLPRRSPLDPLSLATPVDPFCLTIATARRLKRQSRIRSVLGVHAEAKRPRPRTHDPPIPPPRRPLSSSPPDHQHRDRRREVPRRTGHPPSAHRRSLKRASKAGSSLPPALKLTARQTSPSAEHSQRLPTPPKYESPEARQKTVDPGSIPSACWGRADPRRAHSDGAWYSPTRCHP